MKFDFKNLFSKKKKMNVENLEDELNLDDLEDELELPTKNNKTLFKDIKINIDFTSLKNNKKLLYGISGILILTIVSGGGYYYYLMKTTKIELAELKKPLPEIKKIVPRKKVTNKKDSINKSKEKIVKSKIKKDTNLEKDIFSSVMKDNNNKNIDNNSKNSNGINNKSLLSISNNIDIKKEEKSKKLNIKKKLKITNNKNIDDKKIVKELQKDETLLKEKYLPLLTNEDTDNKTDIYALTDEELLKLKDMDKYIEQKQKYMEKVTKFLLKKQKYMETLKNFEEFQKLMKNQEKIEYDKKMKEELENKIANIEKLLDSKLQILNSTIQKLKEKEIVSNAQQNIKNDMEIEQNKTEKEKLTKKNIEEFFKGGQIFVMNNDYIIAVNHNGMETIYKKGEQVLDGFTITSITNNMITLEKNHKFYFYNLKTNLGTDTFTKVVVELPLMVDNSKEEEQFNKKLLKTTKNNKIPEYLSPAERKKLEAKKFFNLTTN